ncbi:VOC family protein [Kaarinaea lacus]
MKVTRFLHASLLVSDTKRSVDFYRHILNLEPNESRPDLGYPGAWLDIGKQQIHLIELPNPDPVQGRPEHGGRDRHTALEVSDIVELQHRLEQYNIPFTKSRSGRGAVFFRDPDGNAIECVEIKD